MYEPRFYQEWYNNKLNSYRVCYRETDLLIRTEYCNSEYCYNYIKNLRIKLDNYIKENHDFLLSLTPVEICNSDPEIVKILKRYSKKAGTGPMAGIAGFFAEQLGKSIINKFNTNTVIVENGGDIFLSAEEECITGIYAGKDSSLSGEIGIKIKPADTPLGICTSAATVGPSLSLGKADAVVVSSKSTVMADVAATALGNKVKSSGDIAEAIEFGRNISELSGIVIIKDEKIGIWGDMEIVKLRKQ